MSEIVPIGSYMGRATADHGSGRLDNEKETPYIKAMMRIEHGPFAGRLVPYQGFTSAAAVERTMQSMMYCGCTFPNDDLTNLTGIETNIVPFEVVHDKYNDKDGNPKVAAKVGFINNPQGAVRPENAMDATAKAAFASQMRGTVAAFKAKQGKSANGTTTPTPTPASSADIPF